MQYTLIRTGRRSICIQLTAAGELVVRAPRRCSRRDIDQFVNSKIDWITTHRQALLARNALRDAFCLNDGDIITICGTPLEIQIREGAAPEIREGRLYLPDGDMDAVRQDMLRLARKFSGPWLKYRLDAWSRDMGVTYRELKFSTARRRWGSCNADGTIHISVFLLFAPERAIDYVLVHELAHRRHFDHSEAFWAEVASAMPDFRQQKQVLRHYQDQPLVQSLAK